MLRSKRTSLSPLWRVKSPRFFFVAAALPTLIGACANARGQIVLDGTTGAAGARIGPNYIIPQSAGRLQGTNLFHSFSQFNINSGESATFTVSSGTAVNNVIARVTGNQSSNIDGLLRSDIPNANLFLINPNGIVFGPGAQLDVQGSFVASTASYVRLADGTRFSAVAPQDALLTSAAPSAFGFLPAIATAKPQTTAAKPSITVAATAAGAVPTTLSVPDNKTLALVGGAVRITGGRLVSIGGQVDVVSVAGHGEVALDVTRPDVLPDVSGVDHLGTVEVLDGASLRAPVGGRVAVRAASLTLDSSSINIDTDIIAGGGIDLLATDTATILNSGVSAETLGSADSGSIHIKAGTLNISGLSTDGKAAVEADSGASGRGGNITLDVGTLSIAKNGSVQALANSSGRGGDVLVNASRRVTIDGDQAAFLTGLAAETAAGTSADGGNVSVLAPLGDVDILRGGQITSTTKGLGNSGAITVTARSLLLDGQDSPDQTLIQARVGRGVQDSGASGQGGPVNVTADKVILRSGGVITATTFGSGSGGEIKIAARSSLKIAGSDASQFTGVFARSSPAINAANPGQGGDITIKAGNLALSGPGAAGGLASTMVPWINVTPKIAGPGAISAQSTGNAAAGQIHASGDVVRINSGGSITVEAPSGAAGDLSLAAGRRLFVDSGTISAAGNTGGNINLVTGHTFYAQHASITAHATGDGGQILIDPPAVVLADRTVINGLSNGRAVFVGIDGEFLKSPDSRILVNPNTHFVFPEVDLSGAIFSLSAAIVSTDAGLVPQCGLNLRGPISSFIITGRGGTPPEPDGWTPDFSLDLNPPK